MAETNSKTIFAKSTPPQDPARFLYTGAAFFLLALTFIGFQLFYLQGRAYPGRPLTPPIRTLLIAHGLSMTAWMLLFVIQPFLIVKRNFKAHILLGKIGALLAASLIVMGAQVAIGAAKANPPELLLWNLTPKQFSAVSLSAIVLFAGFIGIGVWKRKRPEIHKPMMFLGSLTIMAAAIDRIAFIKHLYSDMAWAQLLGPYVPVIAIGGVFFLVKNFLTKSFDRYYAAGYGVLIISGLITMRLATTSLWDTFAGFLIR